MKVLVDTHILGQQNTGIGRYWLNLVQYLNNPQNPSLELVLYGGSLSSNKHKSEPLEQFVPLMNNGLYRIGFGFSHAIQKYKPALIHVNNFAPVIKSIPTVVTVHDVCFKTLPKTFSAKSLLAFQFFFKRSLEQSDVIICVSHTVKQQLLDYYRINSRKIHVIYEGVDPCFQKQHSKQLARKILRDFGIRQPFFLVVGGFEKRKNIVPIVHVFLKLAQAQPKSSIQLVVVGHDDALHKYLVSTFGYGSMTNIMTLGYVEDDILALLYQNARALVFNSLCEGFGLPLIEAMSSKLPVICTDIAVFREIAGNSAIYVKEEWSLLNAMKELVINNGLCYKLGKRGLIRSRLFSWEKTAKETLAVYKEIV